MIMVIHTKEEHEKALAEIEKWMCHQERPVPKNFDALVDAIVKYEKKHYPIGWEEWNT